MCLVTISFLLFNNLCIVAISKKKYNQKNYHAHFLSSRLTGKESHVFNTFPKEHIIKKMLEFNLHVKCAEIQRTTRILELLNVVFKANYFVVTQRKLSLNFYYMVISSYPDKVIKF